jgi:hypothetical protein
MMKREEDRRRIQNLILRVKKLFDSKSIDSVKYGKRIYALKRDALDALNQCGFSNNPIYSQIEREVTFPPLSRFLFPLGKPIVQPPKDSEMKLLRGYCSPSLEILRSRLEQALKLLSHRRPHDRRRPSFRKKTDQQLVREKQIRAVIQKGKVGRRYCLLLDQEGIKPRQTWRDEGCPASYAQAYQSDEWRKRIQNEKSKLA